MGDLVDLYLIRHSDAVPLGENGITEDAERPLTKVGEEHARRAAQALQKKGVTLDRLVTSPLLRAKQTAEQMLRAWQGAAPEVHECDDLAPDGKMRKLGRFLLKLGGERIGLVGHLPHIATLLGWLIGNKKTQVDMAKAGIAYVALGSSPRKGLGTLQWLVTPEWFE